MVGREVQDRSYSEGEEGKEGTSTCETEGTCYQYQI